MSKHIHPDIITAIIDWAARIQASDISWKTGIYPGEMAAFLGLCDATGVQSIVESGRGPDAYSTQVLGLYADVRQVPVASVDFSPIEKHHYASTLQRYRHLRCVAGNSFTEVPRALASLRGPSALLIDGPKLFFANSLSFVSSSLYPVRVIAHHNTVKGSPWWQEFATVYQGAFHYEDLALNSDPRWQEFRAWEKRQTGGYEVRDTKHGLPGRSLAQSSLAMATISDDERSALLSRIPAAKRRWMLSMKRLLKSLFVKYPVSA